MLYLSEARKYFLYRGVTDMRKSFDGLGGLVREELHREPLSGEVFVFLSRKRTQIRLLLWEGDGFSIYSKRLEKGTFELPSHIKENMEVQCDDLLFLLKGIKLSSIEKRKRFSLMRDEILNN